MALTVLLAALISNDARAATRAFSKRFSTNANGDIIITGNALMTCNAASGLNAATCDAGRNRTGGGSGATNMDVNNTHLMMNINADTDPTTTNSSSADLAMPAGSAVIWAGLYWTGETATASARSQVLFGTPNSFGYTTITAQQIDFDTSATPRYQSFQDVTGLVQAAGNGTYWVANAATTINANNDFAGWSLVVVYGNISHPLRNLSVFDGFQSVSTAAGVTIPLSGFLTPLSGPISTKLGTVVMEGDYGHAGDTYVGDFFQLNGTNLSEGALRPVNDFYNSSITDSGAYMNARNPAYLNQFGFDIVSRYNVPAGLITNGATTATVRVGTGGETVYPGVITFSTDIYVPIITPNITKTITDLNGGNIVPGDTLRFTISMSNTGLDTGTNLVLTDPIPPHTTYVPGSMRVISGANAGAKSDSGGDDQAEYIASGTPRVVMRLGNNANTTQGGELPYLSSTSVSFDVTLDANTPAGTILSNTATISYSGQTIATTFAGASSAATATITAPPTITKNFSPNPVAVNGNSTMTIVVTNPASNSQNLTGVAFTDSYPAGMINSTPANALLSCTGGSSATLVNSGDGGGSIGISNGSILIGGSCTITVSVKSAAQGNYTNTTGAVTSSNGGSGTAASATLSVGKPAVTLKTFTPASILSGGTSQVQLALTNPSVLTINNMAFSDTLNGMAVDGTPGVSNDCGGTFSAAAGASSVALSGGSMSPGGTCTISFNVTSSTVGIQTNQTSGVTSTETGSAGLPSNVATLTVIGPPQATKTFTPASVAVGSSSQLKIVLTNPNPTTTITGVAFTDTYPTSPNLVNATAPNASLSCSGGSSATLVGGVAGGNTIGINGGSLAPGGSCTINVNVSAASAATYTDDADTISTTNAGSGTTPSASLNVSSLTPPTVTKGFGSGTVAAGTSTLMTITLTNTNAIGAGNRINGISFTDTYPTGLVNASAPSTTCLDQAGNPLTAVGVNGGSSVGLVGGSLPATAAVDSCTITVQVKSDAQGTYFNNIPAGTVVTSNAATYASDASATLTVTGSPIVATYFSPNTIVPGGTSTKTVVVSNPNNAAMTAVAFTDTYPSQLFNTNPKSTSFVCSAGSTYGTVTAANSGSTLALSSTTIAANGNCTITSTVTAGTAGSYTNLLPAGTVTSGSGSNLTDAKATLYVASGPSTSKYFTPNPVLPGQPSTVTITLSNTFSSDMTGVSFTDSYPSGMVNANPSNAQAVCTGGGSATLSGGVAGTNNVGITGGTIISGQSCTITSNVEVAAFGNYLNTTGQINSSSHGNNSIGAQSTLTVMGVPTATVDFSPTSVATSVSSLMTVTLTNPNTTASVTGVAFTDTYPAGLLNSATPAAATSCAGATVAAVASENSLAISGGTIPPGGSCTVTVNVLSSASGSYLNSTGAISTTNAGTGSSASATLTVTSGSAWGKVYSDTNHNGSLDGSEIGPGLSQYVKLATRSGSSCTSPALQFATPDPASGAYSITGIAPGDYCLILSTNTNLTDAAVSVSSGWLLTEGGTGIRQVSIPNGPLPVQNFGLYNGSKISGKVFSDTGAGSGTANNGVQDGAEPGIGGTSVKATDNSGATVYDTALTNGSGDFTLWIPASGTGQVKIAETNPSGYLSTGGNTGSSGGSYDRNSDAITFSNVAGSSYGSLTFADVPGNRFLGDNTSSALPGTVVFYPHSFTAGSGGSVSFATTIAASPAIAGWNEVFYRDLNCNGALDSGEPQITAAVSLAAAEQLCIIVKEFVPANAPIGATNLATTTATFSYTNAGPALNSSQTRTDTTTVGTSSSAGLTLTKSVSQTQALPGANLVYTIQYGNNSNGSLSNIVIRDSIPAFTSLTAAASNPCCVNNATPCFGETAALPANITTCTPTTSGDSITWTLGGSLAPGATGKVKFGVTVQP